MNYLTGKQIELRAVEPEDLDALYRWENDSSLWIYGSTVSPFSRYLLKQYIENYTADITRDKQLRLIIMRKESRQVIGAIDCFDYDTTNRSSDRSPHRSRSQTTRIRTRCPRNIRRICFPFFYTCINYMYIFPFVTQPA